MGYARCHVLSAAHLAHEQRTRYAGVVREVETRLKSADDPFTSMRNRTAVRLLRDLWEVWTAAVAVVMP